MVLCLWMIARMVGAYNYLFNDALPCHYNFDAGGSSVNTGELGDSSVVIIPPPSQLESTMSSGLSSTQDMPGPSGNSASSIMDDGEKAGSIQNKRK